MIFGDILNESVNNTMDSNDFEICLCIENYMLTQMALANGDIECVDEAKTYLKVEAEIKYAMKKFREKERKIPELEKDIDRCEKALVKAKEELEKYEKSSKPKKFINNLGNILSTVVDIAYLTNDGKRVFYTGDNGTPNLNGSIDMAKRGEISNMFELYKRDLVLTIKELEYTLKYLKKELATAKKQK